MTKKDWQVATNNSYISKTKENLFMDNRPTVHFQLQASHLEVIVDCCIFSMRQKCPVC